MSIFSSSLKSSSFASVISLLPLRLCPTVMGETLACNPLGPAVLIYTLAFLPLGPAVLIDTRAFLPLGPAVLVKNTSDYFIRTNSIGRYADVPFTSDISVDRFRAFLSTSS